MNLPIDFSGEAFRQSTAMLLDLFNFAKQKQLPRQTNLQHPPHCQRNYKPNSRFFLIRLSKEE